MALDFFDMRMKSEILSNAKSASLKMVQKEGGRTGAGGFPAPAKAAQGKVVPEKVALGKAAPVKTALGKAASREVVPEKVASENAVQGETASWKTASTKTASEGTASGEVVGGKIASVGVGPENFCGAFSPGHCAPVESILESLDTSKTRTRKCTARKSASSKKSLAADMGKIELSIAAPNARDCAAKVKSDAAKPEKTEFFLELSNARGGEAAPFKDYLSRIRAAKLAADKFAESNISELDTPRASLELLWEMFFDCLCSSRQLEPSDFNTLAGVIQKLSAARSQIENSGSRRGGRGDSDGGLSREVLEKIERQLKLL